MCFRMKCNKHFIRSLHYALYSYLIYIHIVFFVKTTNVYRTNTLTTQGVNDAWQIGAAPQGDGGDTVTLEHLPSAAARTLSLANGDTSGDSHNLIRPISTLRLSGPVTHLKYPTGQKIPAQGVPSNLAPIARVIWVCPRCVDNRPSAVLH